MIINNPYFLRNINIENLAMKLLNETVGQENVPIDLIELANFLDIKVEFSYEKFCNNNDLGLTEFYSSETPPKIFINANVFGKSYSDINNVTLLNKCRFTIAHEIGHCYIPTHQDIQTQQLLQSKNNPHSYAYSRQKEQEADEFASSLLIPEINICKKYLDNSSELFKNAKAISERFKVSNQVAIMRLISLNKDAIGAILFIDTKEGKIKWYKATETFRNYKNGVWINVGTTIPTRSVAHDLLKNDLRQDGVPNNMNIDIWFPGYRGKNQITFKECSVHFSKYIMTYLEIIDTSEYNLYF